MSEKSMLNGLHYSFFMEEIIVRSICFNIRIVIRIIIISKLLL